MVAVEPLLMGHLHSVDTKFGPGKNFQIIFESVTAIEGTPLFRGKEHIFWVPKPGLTSIQGTLSTQKMTDHKEIRVDNFKSTLITIMEAFKN